LVFFLSLLAVFVFAFGITTQATLYPGNKFDLELFKNLISKAYWPIYGEMKILDEINDKEACTRYGTCPEPSGVAFSYILLMIYMVTVNVLLLNLLIAMFSSTFQKVEN
jgi:hypothetical protein